LFGFGKRQRIAPIPGQLPLVIEGVNKRYPDGTWANLDISFSANPGEILGILGPNGAGKTTLIRQITTELASTSGEIAVFGYDVNKDPFNVKALIGVLPQQSALYDYLTVRQHLKIFAKFRGLSSERGHKRTEELIEELRLNDYADTTISKLSGGLERRLLVGVAALARPPLLVLDEPTTGLDPESRRNLWSLLSSYREWGATVVLTTHNMEEAEVLCDRIGIIQNGRMLALNTLDNLRASNSYGFKIAYAANGSVGKTETIYGSTDQELVDTARDRGIEDYVLTRTTLEDVYMALTDEPGEIYRSGE
jgi:ABC-2 type transport system ATP-binding protein